MADEPHGGEPDGGPVILKTGCSLWYRWFTSPAALTIRPGRVECENVIGGAVVHREPEILMVRARFLPRPGCTVFVLTDDDGARGYISPLFNRGRIRAALLEAGFAVRERTAWVVLAGCLVIPPLTK